MLTFSSPIHLQATQATTQPRLTNKYACPTALTEGKALVVTAPTQKWRGSANTNNCASNKVGAYRQFSVPNRHLRVAANRYAQLEKQIQKSKSINGIHRLL